MPGMILRMRFAGDHDLHRHVGIGQDLLQPVDVAEQQRRALISREPAGEADRERVGIEHFASRRISALEALRSTANVTMRSRTNAIRRRLRRRCASQSSWSGMSWIRSQVLGSG